MILHVEVYVYVAKDKDKDVGVYVYISGIVLLAFLLCMIPLMIRNLLVAFPR